MDVRKLLLAFYSISSVGFSVYAVSLHQAARIGNTRLVRLALFQGVSVNERDRERKTPLHKAASGGHPNVAQLLVERGAKVDPEDVKKQTPLHKAARSLGRAGNVLTAKKRAQVISYLLSQGANAKARDNLERTPLHYVAAWAESTGIGLMPQAVRRGVLNSLGGAMVDLNKAGADWNVQDSQGRTPLHYAVMGGSPHLVLWLMKKGVRIDIKDNDGKLPEDYAFGAVGDVIYAETASREFRALFQPGAEKERKRFIEKLEDKLEKDIRYMEEQQRIGRSPEELLLFQKSVDEQRELIESLKKRTPQASNIGRLRRRSRRGRKVRSQRA